MREEDAQKISSVSSYPQEFVSTLDKCHCSLDMGGTRLFLKTPTPDGVIPTAFHSPATSTKWSVLCLVLSVARRRREQTSRKKEAVEEER